MKFTVTMPVVVNGVDTEVDVTGSVSPIVRGNTYGLPENCWPDEGGEVEIEEVALDGKPFELTPEQTEKAEELLRERAWEEDECPDSDPYHGEGE